MDQPVPRQEPARSGDYETGDFARWLDHQARLLRAGRFAELDAANIAEELEGQVRRDKREVRTRLRRILQHLLKFEHQPARRSPSWRNTIAEQRLRTALVLADSPSFRRLLPGWIAIEYRLAVARAAAETGLPESAFPAACPYAVDQIVNDAFWPGPPPAARGAPE